MSWGKTMVQLSVDLLDETLESVYGCSEAIKTLESFTILVPWYIAVAVTH